MKVLFFITRSDTIGGAQVHVRDLSKALLALGHEVKVVVGDKGLYFDHLRHLGIDVQSIDGLKREVSLLGDTRALAHFPWAGVFHFPHHAQAKAH